MPSLPPWLLGELSEPRLPLHRITQLHAKAVRLFFSTDPFVATGIFRFYAFHGRLRSARRLFDLCPQRSVFLWNANIRAHAKAGDFAQTFSLFASMLRAGAPAPDEYTFACILRAAAESFGLCKVRLVHGMMDVSGLWRSPICGAALVTSYSKLKVVRDARRVFDEMPERDLVLWNAMLSGYGGENFAFECFECFRQMKRLGVRPDGYTMVALISSICDSNSLASAGEVHGFCVKGGLDSGAHVVTALVSMYSRVHELTLAHRVFSEYADPDLVMWSALITGFSQSGEWGNALKLFSEMSKCRGMAPDHVLLASVIAACAQSAAVEPGKEVHAYAIRHSLETNLGVLFALIDMYFKCGFVRLGLHVFRNMAEKSSVAYNAAISGLGIHGLADEAFALFEEMLRTGFKPDSSTFSALLCACCHCNLAIEGKDLFGKMEKIYGVTPEMEHYVYMVKLLVSLGELEEAYNLIIAMPIIPDSGVWGALLSGCIYHENSGLSEIAARHLFKIDPQKPAYKVMLSNIYAAEGRWNDVNNLRVAMLGNGSKKPTGTSMVAIALPSDHQIHL